jgi:hypothetical protein
MKSSTGTSRTIRISLTTGCPNYQNQFNDGVSITPEKLMQNALTKYDTIMQRKATSGEKENRVLALAAETKKDDAMTVLLAKIASLEANYAASNKGNYNKSNKGTVANKVHVWKKVAPTDSEPKITVKTVNDKKTFHWRPHHQMWTIHQPKDCTYKKEGTSNENATGNNKAPERKGEDQKLVLNRALLAFLNQDVEECCLRLLTSVGKLLYYFLYCLIVVYINVFMIQIFDSYTMGMSSRLMFGSVLVIVAYLLSLVATTNTLYTNTSSTSRPSSYYNNQEIFLQHFE